MNAEDLEWGLLMTVGGMGTVFLLLAVLMGVLMLIGWFDKRTVAGAAAKAQLAAAAAAPAIAPAVVEDTSEPETIAPGMQILHDGLTADQIAAVALAVTVHRKVRRAQAAPAMRSHQPGSHLYASRWVSVGRGQQNTSWRKN